MNHDITPIVAVAPRQRTPRSACWTRRVSSVLLAITAAMVVMPGRVFAQFDDVQPTNSGLPGAGLFANIIGWGKWVGLGVCILAMVYGAATWRGMGGNSGRGVEGKMYVGAGAIGAMVIGVAVVAVNTLYGAGQAGG